MSGPRDHEWKRLARRTAGGWYDLETEDTGSIPVRLFLSESLLSEAEPALYGQIVAATQFPGTRCVVITPDAHVGYGVPVGCVIATDKNEGAIALGPVGFDIGCGMISAKSAVPASMATRNRCLEFNREVMSRVSLGRGGESRYFDNLTENDFMLLVRGGAAAYVELVGSALDRQRAERACFEVDPDWLPPWGGKGMPERGIKQLGSLGGGNHFIELQRGVSASEDPKHSDAGTLYLQIHTGSRGFGHGLATNYFELARAERPELGNRLELGYFLPDSQHYRGYLNAVAAGANFAIINRLVIFEQVAKAFRKVFGEPLELVYELSHNLVQSEHHPTFGDLWVHRKGATRALPPGHSTLSNTLFSDTGHPVLVPGSNRDESYILEPLPGSEASLYSVCHGAGRRMSRGEAMRQLDQRQVNETYRHAGIVVNDDGPVPLDESSACYKRASSVVGAITDARLANVKIRLWPLSSLKGDEASERAPAQRERRKEKSARKQKHKEERRRKRGTFDD